MAHCSAFFTALLFLIAALITEQLALAQLYDRDSDEDDRQLLDDYGDYGPAVDPAAGSSDSDEWDEGYNDRQYPGREDDGGGGGDAIEGEDTGDEEDLPGRGDEESHQHQQHSNQLDPDEEEDLEQARIPTYAENLYGGQRNRLHEVPLSGRAGYHSTKSRKLPSSYVNPDTMPTLPEESGEDYDDDGGPVDNNSLDERGGAVEREESQHEYNSHGPRHYHPTTKPSNTLVT